MCGLVAMLDHTKFPDAVERLDRALDAMSHRGLLGRRGTWFGERGALGHVRLPIVGTGPEHDQPLVGDDCAAAFVGEIHNYQDLSSADCDSRLVIPAWRAGVDAFRLFDGFWSIALFDEREKLSCLMVDYLAQKPLYYRSDVCVAASELEALKAFGPMKLDRTYLSNVRKWGYDPTGRTPYESVSTIARGQVMLADYYDPAAFVMQTYYPLVAEDAPPTPERIRDAIERSVRRRLIADVPVAILVSGGLDSAIVSLLAAEQGADVRAFHVQNDEAEYARSVAARGDFTLHQVTLPDAPGPTSVWSQSAVLRAMQEPVDLGSVLPQYLLGAAISDQGYRVALAGDGADELFGGYRRAKDYDCQWSDVFCELVHYHLPRLDRCMMASAVELRSPFLAPYVVEAALALPHDRRQVKELLKEAFSDIVPEDVLLRDKKPLRVGDPYDQAARNALVDLFVRENS